MGLTPYLDTSVLVPLFAADALADRAEAWLRTQPDSCLVSDFARLEFAAAIARKQRTGILTKPEAGAALGRFDEWAAAVAQPATLTPADLGLARTWIAQLEMTLRAPDALHLAIGARLGATVVTFDAGMAAAARRLGIPVAAA